MPASWMQPVKPASPPVRYIHTRLLRYHPCVVDLRWRRAVHSCDVCPYRSVAGSILPGRAGPVVRCSAVHYGICSAVKPAGVVGVVSAVNGKQAVRSTSPPPPPLPAKRRINVPIIVQKPQQVITSLANGGQRSR